MDMKVNGPKDPILTSLDGIRRTLRKLERLVGPKAQSSIDGWMLPEQAAVYAKMTTRALAKLARQKRIKAGSDGRKWKFKAEDIDAFFLANGRAR